MAAQVDRDEEPPLLLRFTGRGDGGDHLGGGRGLGVLDGSSTPDQAVPTARQRRHGRGPLRLALAGGDRREPGRPPALQELVDVQVGGGTEWFLPAEHPENVGGSDQHAAGVGDAVEAAKDQAQEFFRPPGGGGPAG